MSGETGGVKGGAPTGQAHSSGFDPGAIWDKISSKLADLGIPWFKGSSDPGDNATQVAEAAGQGNNAAFIEGSTRLAQDLQQHARGA